MLELLSLSSSLSAIYLRRAGCVRSDPQQRQRADTAREIAWRRPCLDKRKGAARGRGERSNKWGKVESSSPRDQKRFPSPTVLCLHLFLALSPLLSSTTSELSDCKTMLSLSRAGVQPAPTTSKAGNPAPTEVGRAAALPRRSLLSTSLTSTSTTGLSSSARRRRRELSSVASAAQARDGTLFKLSFIL